MKPIRMPLLLGLPSNNMKSRWLGTSVECTYAGTSHGTRMTAAIVLEWLFMIFTLDFRRPGLLSKQQIEYSSFTHTYHIDKTKEKPWQCTCG